MFWAFIIGNISYYVIGIILAFVFKDNRAFCKYICPITVFLKPMSYFSLLRIKCDKNKCISCGKCKKICPMNVDVTDNSRKRKNGTECILCFECVVNCPKNALWNSSHPQWPSSAGFSDAPHPPQWPSFYYPWLADAPYITGSCLYLPPGQAPSGKIPAPMNLQGF